MNTTTPETATPTDAPGTDETGKPRRLSIRALAHLATALKFLTRFRIFQDRQWPDGVLRESVIWFPFIGLVVGSVGAAVDGLCSLAGMTPFMTAPLAVTAMVWLTGALHEGGLANLVDGLGGGNTRERKLEIMKDSRIGTYGTVTLILVLTIKCATIYSLASSDLVFAGLAIAGVWSRMLMVLVAAWLGPISPEGPVAQICKPAGERLVIGLIFAVLITLFLADATASAMMLAAGVVAALLVAAVAKVQLGGANRDVMGTVQQTVEISMLVLVVATQA